MSRSRSVSATTSELKPGALVPAGVGRSSAAISGFAAVVRAACGVFAMVRFVLLGGLVAGDPIRSRAPTQQGGAGGARLWRAEIVADFDLGSFCHFADSAAERAGRPRSLSPRSAFAKASADRAGRACPPSPEGRRRVGVRG